MQGARLLHCNESANACSTALFEYEMLSALAAPFGHFSEDCKTKSPTACTAEAWTRTQALTNLPRTPLVCMRAPSV